MNPLTQSQKTTIRPLLIALGLAYFALSSTAQAVLPAPDGGYPGFNTAEGTSALFTRTTGVWNTALGFQALFNDTTGNSNTAVGLNALFRNTSGFNNTATGTAALQFNSTGRGNTANGVQALYSNSTGYWNTAIGGGALFRNTLGIQNTADGFEALRNNIYGSQNTAIGFRALYHSTNNTGLPHWFGTQNTAVGFQALYNNITGGNNIAVGVNAGYNIGDLGQINNIDIGNLGVGDDFGTIRVGTPVSQTRAFIAGIRGVATGTANAVPVVIDSAGQLGTTSSSRRFKKEIKPMDQTSEAILGLKPVMFQYKSDSKGTPQFGLIAEEVAALNPDLVVRDEKGDIYTVRYEAVNAMLLNEFLKEHRNIAEQQSTIAELKTTVAQQQKQIEALTATVRKVSERVKLRAHAPQIAANDD
jgi:uncharacterized coiled-coil protein SlyX